MRNGPCRCNPIESGRVYRRRVLGGWAVLGRRVELDGFLFRHNGDVVDLV